MPFSHDLPEYDRSSHGRPSYTSLRSNYVNVTYLIASIVTTGGMCKIHRTNF